MRSQTQTQTHNSNSNSNFNQTPIARSEYNDVLKKLNHYMLYPNLLGRVDLTYKNQTSTNIEKEKPQEWNYAEKEKLSGSKRDSMFFPDGKDKDKLFWIYYVIVNGFTKYESIERSRFLVEKNAKLECIEIVRKNRKLLTENKIRGVRDSLEDDLVNNKKISVVSFIALCVLHGLNIMYVCKQKYFEVACDPETDHVYVLHEFQGVKDNFAYEKTSDKAVLDKYRNDYFKCNSLTNPIKGVSAYKVDELKEICDKLKINYAGQKVTKNKLYELILESL